jgi:hypothetical protein
MACLHDYRGSAATVAVTDSIAGFLAGLCDEHASVLEPGGGRDGR